MDAITQLNAALADRYEVEREIGAGGMATVFLARDLKHDRNVARQQTLFKDPTRRTLSRAQYGVHPDGRHFVVLRAPAEDEAEVVVVLNWITEVRAKLAQAGKR